MLLTIKSCGDEMFGDLVLNKEISLPLQIKEYIKSMILKGMFLEGEKLPSTRELCKVLSVSRNTIIEAYELLENEGIIKSVKYKGAFVKYKSVIDNSDWQVSWESRLNNYAVKAEELDIMKHGALWKEGMISFSSIAPDSRLFDLEEFKRAFLNCISLEKDKILNYGYAQGYIYLIEYLIRYMEEKGVNIKGKNLIITDGFTEGFNLVLRSITNPGDIIVCENPTHNTAIKIMKLHGLNIKGITMEDDGLNLEQLENVLKTNKPKLAYLIPSYHNPTGIVMSPQKREKTYEMLRKYDVPIVEDGFNEELRHTSSHITPIISLGGEENGVVYIGSFSKILFPGLRIGWIMADNKLISYLESIKRSENIHTSFLDQAILYQYLNSGNFNKYIKKVRKVYKEKFEFALECAKKYIPHKKITSEGGLHIFIELPNVSSRKVLKLCYEKGVIFTLGDIFYTDGTGKDTLRLGFSRVSKDEIEKGFQIIGHSVRYIMK